MAGRKRISVIMPAYNEEECVEALYNRLGSVCDALIGYEFEYILVDNGSTDNTYAIAATIHRRDPRLKVLKLTRNFLPEGGIAAGLSIASGDAAIIMSADLEDPPELIPEFIAKWEQGYENVYGVIEKRSTSAVRSFNSSLFYKLLHRMTGGMIPKDVADFRLIDRRLVDMLNRMPERNRFFRGLAAWSGYKSLGIPFERGLRHGGESKASTRVVLNLAARGLCSFSVTPLRLPFLLGGLLSVPSFIALVYILCSVMISGWHPMSGFGIIVYMNLFLFGVLFMVLGVMGEYIGQISSEVKGRPLFMVDSHLGLD